jgi:leucyl-tRNA synthetase
VQVGGKLRDRLELAAGLTEAAAREAALKSEKVARALAGKLPRNVVYVPDRLINLVP